MHISEEGSDARASIPSLTEGEPGPQLGDIRDSAKGHGYFSTSKTPLGGSLFIRCRTIWGTEKGTLIYRTTLIETL